jgi:hypothetical protein
MGIEMAFPDRKGSRYGWELKLKKIQFRSGLQPCVLWVAEMASYALRVSAGVYILKQHEQAQFNWPKKGSRRGLPAVERNAIISIRRLNQIVIITQAGAAFIRVETNRG